MVGYRTVDLELVMLHADWRVFFYVGVICIRNVYIQLWLLVVRDRIIAVGLLELFAS